MIDDRAGVARRSLVFGLAGLALPAWGAETRWSRRSRHNWVEVVHHPDGRLELLLDGSRQSAYDPSDPLGAVYGYTQTLFEGIERTPLAASGAGRALIIGLGGGSVCRVLRARWPRVEVHAVELDRVVVRAARKFFDLDPAVNVHLGDGRAFLDRDRGPWDLIVLDAASEDYVPPSLQTVECLRRVAMLLSPTGVVLANAWRFAANASAEASTWAAVFPGATERWVPEPEENRVFAAGPGWRPGPKHRPVEVAVAVAPLTD